MTQTKHTSSIHPYNMQQEYLGHSKVNRESEYQPYEPKGNSYHAYPVSQDDANLQISSIQPYNIQKEYLGLTKFKQEPDNQPYNSKDHAYPISQDDTNSRISFSNSLLEPSQFMKRTRVESKVPASMQQMFSPVPLNDETSKATFSSVSNLLHNSPAKPIPKTDSIYSYFESKRIFDKRNWGKIKSRGDHKARPINRKNQTVSSIPNRWSDLVIGRWPNTAKHFLNLEKRKKHNSELSSFRKRGTLGVNEFSTKKLPWLLGRAKRDVREKMFPGT